MRQFRTGLRIQRSVTLDVQLLIMRYSLQLARFGFVTVLLGLGVYLQAHQVYAGVTTSGVQDFRLGNYAFYENANSITPGQTLAGTNTPVQLTNSGDAFRMRTGIRSSIDFLSVSVGAQHTCALGGDNQAYCWGYNSSGRLGNGTTTASPIPVAVDTTGVLSGKTIKSLRAGGEHSCAVANDDLVYCWGNGFFGALGNASNTNSNVPVAVNTAGVLAGKTIKQLSAGRSQNCAIASDDLTYCWGANIDGQLGNASNTNSNVPVAVSTAGVLTGKTIKQISSGYLMSCAVASDDQAYCWGANTYGKLGDGTMNPTNVPVAVSTSGVLSGKTIKTIASGYNHSCVRLPATTKRIAGGVITKGN